MRSSSDGLPARTRRRAREVPRYGPYLGDWAVRRAPLRRSSGAAVTSAPSSQGRSSMAIVVNLDELLYARRMTLTELADRVGITLANLSILKTGKAKAIRFSTLDAICRQLGCQPGDLLAFNADGVSAEEKLATDAL